MLPIFRSLLNTIGRGYRRCLRRPVFIAVTGSCGKTTTKELIAAVLSTHLCGRVTPGNCNTPYHVVRNVLATRPRDQFCLLEVSVADRTTVPFELSLGLIRPKIGVVTNIGTDHFSLFGSIEAIAAEKGKLVAALPADGTAVLNADDPRVLAMASRCAGRIMTYGLAPTADVRAADVRGDWPERLSFRATCGERSARVQTQLCGTHMLPNVLAAIAVGIAMNVSLDDAAAAIATVPPFPGRMSPLTTADGITFIRDDQKAPLWSIPIGLDFVHRATAHRKIVVIGTISDFPGNPKRKYPRVARAALDVAGMVFFVGQKSANCLSARSHAKGSALRTFVTTDQLRKFLHTFLQPGDLVFLKGSEHADNLEQIVTTWSDRPAELKASRPDLVEHQNLERGSSEQLQVIIGLGNPGKKYQNTPHNVGQLALDRLAELLETTWSHDDFGSIASARLSDSSIMLLKPATYVNDTGPLLLQIAERFGFRPEDCVLLHDDVDLPLGTVRARMRGSSAGHRGVQSLISTFETETFRRVKIGVGKPADGSALVDHVLRPFSGAQLELIDSICREAAKRVLEMVEQREPQQNTELFAPR